MTQGRAADRGTAATISAAFLGHVDDRADQAALICCSPRASRRNTTFAELRELYRRTATTFTAAGIGRGTRSAVLVRDPLTLIGSIYALTALRAVPILVDAGLPLRALKRCFDDVAPEAFIGGGTAHAARLLLGWGRDTARIAVRTGKSSTPVSDAGRSSVDDVLPDAEDPALLAFTSGSTGTPKAAQYTQRQLVGQAGLMGEALGMTAGSVVVAGFAPFALYGPALGATVVIPDMDFRKPAAVDPGRLVRAVRETGASALFGSPALLAVVARHCADHHIVLDTLTTVASFGAPLPGALLDLLDRCVPAEARIRSVYGATECLPADVIDRQELAATGQDRHDGAGTCLGRPLPEVTVRVIRATADPVPAWSPGLQVPVGETGEITVAGAHVSRRYFGRPDADGAAKIRHGDEVIHRTGDLGRFDERGRLWLSGRRAHRVPTTAGHLDTERVEPACDAVPGVRRTALVDAGVPVLCIELDPGAGRGRHTAVVSAVRDRLAGTCGPDTVREVLIHPGFPVDIRHNAKIDRDRLARWARRRLDRSGHGRAGQRR